MKFQELETKPATPKESVHFFGSDVVINAEGSWYLNEERVYVECFDDAVSTIKEKISSYKDKTNGLLEESHSKEQVFKIAKKYNQRVSEGILENCTKTASSKQLTNDKAILELRRQDCNLINDKYIFVLESGELVALGEDELCLLEKFDQELIDHAKKNSENLKQIFRGVY